MGPWFNPSLGAQYDHVAVSHGQENTDVELTRASGVRPLRLDNIVFRNNDVVEHVVQIKLGGTIWLDVVIPAGAGVGGVDPFEFFVATALTLGLSFLVLQQGTHVDLNVPDTIGDTASIDVSLLSAII